MIGYWEGGSKAKMQESKIKNWKKRIRISNYAIIDENDLWIVSNYTNVLMNYDISEGILKEVYSFPEKLIGSYLTVSYVKDRDKLFFAPYNSQNLWCFHIAKKEFEKIDLKLKDNEKNTQQKFRAIFNYKHSLILIGYRVPCILRIDIDTNIVQRYDGYLIELKKRGIKNDEIFLGYSYQLIGDSLYLPMLNYNIIIIFHLIDNHFELCNIENLDSMGFDAIDYADGMFRLISSNGREVIWNPEEKQEALYSLNLPESYGRNYWKTMHYNSMAVYFPQFDTKIWIKKDNEEVKAFSFSYPESPIIPNSSKYEFIEQNNEKIYFQVRATGDCYYLDLEKMEIYLVKLEIPKDDICNQLLKKIVDSMNKEKINETEMINIENYIPFFKYNRVEEIKKEKRKGELIYRSLK